MNGFMSLFVNHSETLCLTCTEIKILFSFSSREKINSSDRYGTQTPVRDKYHNRQQYLDVNRSRPSQRRRVMCQTARRQVEM